MTGGKRSGFERSMGFQHEIVFAGLCLILIFLPLPYGGSEPWALFAFELMVWILFIIHASDRLATARRGAPGGAEAVATGWPRPITALLAVFFAMALLQVIPLPRPFVAWVSPRIPAIHGSSDWLPLALAPALSLFELLKYAAYAGFGFLLYATARSKAKIHILAIVMLAAGLFQALYGLGEFFGGTHAIFGWKNIYNQSSAFGTFVNRNHYSAFLEMALALALGYLLARADFFAMKPGLPWRNKILWFDQERLQKTIIAGMAAVLLGLGIIFSWSRSGAFVFLAELLVMIVLVMWLDRREAGNNIRHNAGVTGGAVRSRRLIRAVFVTVTGIALLLGISPLLQRFSSEQVLNETRPLYYKFTADAIRAFPLAGVGTGCFLYGYNLFEAEYTHGLTTHAHNDYLETLAESGIPGGMALFAAALAALAVMAARWRRCNDHFLRGLGLGCMAGISGMLIHSFSDFSLRMPANATYLVALFALGLRTVSLKAPGTEIARAKTTTGPRRRSLGKAIGTAVIITLPLFFTVRENMGFVRLAEYQRARAGLAAQGRSLMSGFPKLERLLAQAAWWSENPRFSAELGRLYFEMAVAENISDQAPRRDAFLEKAEAATQRRLRQNPADAMAYYDMSRIYLLFNYPLLTYREETRHYLRRALASKPHDLFLNIEAVHNFVVMWNDLNSAEKKWLFAQLRSVWPVNAGRFYPALARRWLGRHKNLDRLLEILGRDPVVWSTAAGYIKK